MVQRSASRKRQPILGMLGMCWQVCRWAKHLEPCVQAEVPLCYWTLLTGHGIRFARSRLPICHNRSIVPIQHATHNLSAAELQAQQSHAGVKLYGLAAAHKTSGSALKDRSSCAGGHSALTERTRDIARPLRQDLSPQSCRSIVLRGLATAVPSRFNSREESGHVVAPLLLKGSQPSPRASFLVWHC